jgi:tetratricopeptide (TPR) repeat protein
MSDPERTPRQFSALTPRLRRLLRVILIAFVLMIWNSLWLLVSTASGRVTGVSTESLLTIWIFLLHVVLGLLLVVPVVVYGFCHLLRARRSPNFNARRVGYVLFASSLLLLLSGIVLLRVEAIPNPFDSGDDRDVVWWIHVLIPVVIIWLFIAHRMVGPRLRWRVGGRWAIATVVFMVFAVLFNVVVMPGTLPAWNDDLVVSPPLGGSMSRISGASSIISVADMTAIENCVECHPDVHAGWSNSAHRFSSFDNPVYAASVRSTRESDDSNGGMSTFCAGCHDPVLLVSGGFEDPRLDDPTIDPADIPGATAGVNCLVCHAISHVEPFGNGSWTMTPPVRYPFHDAESAPLQWLHRQLIRSRPGFHKATMNRPGVTDSALLCGTCHKAWIPEGLNDYRWLHGQDHYDSWRLSGVSGHGVDSWRWPETPSTDCNACHMNLIPSGGMAARVRGEGQVPTVHDHLFAAGNTALPVLLELPDRKSVLAAHQAMLEKSMRVDIVGLREDGRIDGAFLGPIGAETPVLRPGATYLLEVVSRNLGTGHAFTQGTVDSNEIWLDVSVHAGDRLIGRSGSIDEEGVVDPWAYRLNAFVIDADGNRIENRVPQQVFTSVYDHQVPPGSASVTHYRLEVPEDLQDSIRVEVAIRYRKFDRALMDFTYGDARGLQMVEELPAMLVARDAVELPVGVGASTPPSSEPSIPAWERLYDYGIGLFRLGPRGPLRQAEEIFSRLAKLGRHEGDFGLARVHLLQGRYEEAIASLNRAGTSGSTVAPWGITYLSGVTDLERGLFEPARERFRSLAEFQQRDFPAATRRGFDFSGDDRLLLDLASTELRLARTGAAMGLVTVLDLCDTVLNRNPQDFRAWWIRGQVLDLLGDRKTSVDTDLQLQSSLPKLTDKPADPAGVARAYHELFRPDTQAAERAVREARKRYPWADHAANSSAIYDLNMHVEAELD